MRKMLQSGDSRPNLAKPRLEKPLQVTQEKRDRPSACVPYTYSLLLALSERSESKGEVAERLKAAVC